MSGPLGAALGRDLGWRFPFAVLAALALACLALLAVAVPAFRRSPRVWPRSCRR